MAADPSGIFDTGFLLALQVVSFEDQASVEHDPLAVAVAQAQFRRLGFSVIMIGEAPVRLPWPEKNTISTLSA